MRPRGDLQRRVCGVDSIAERRERRRFVRFTRTPRLRGFEGVSDDAPHQTSRPARRVEPEQVRPRLWGNRRWADPWFDDLSASRPKPVEDAHWIDHNRRDAAGRREPLRKDAECVRLAGAPLTEDDAGVRAVGVNPDRGPGAAVACEERPELDGWEPFVADLAVRAG